MSDRPNQAQLDAIIAEIQQARDNVVSQRNQLTAKISAYDDILQVLAVQFQDTRESE